MAKRKTSKSKTIRAGDSLTIGLDIGYGVVKAVTGTASILFPSVMGHAREIKFQQEAIQQKYPGDQITDEDSQWFIGDLALAQIPVGELLRLRGRTANEKTMGNAFRLRLAKTAIAKLVQGVWGRDVVHIRLAVGLPVDHMEDAPELKESLLTQHLIKTDIGEFIANVTDVMVMPQGYGAIYSQMLTHHPVKSTYITPICGQESLMLGHTPLTLPLMMTVSSSRPRVAVSKAVCLLHRNVSLPYWNANTEKKYPTKSLSKFLRQACSRLAAHLSIIEKMLKKPLPHSEAQPLD